MRSVSLQQRAKLVAVVFVCLSCHIAAQCGRTQEKLPDRRGYYDRLAA